MYTEEELKKAEKFVKGMKKTKEELDKDAENIVTRWGKNLINYEGIRVRCYIHRHNGVAVVYDISYPEFGANMELRYENGEMGYSKGSTGRITKRENPRQYDIILLQAKLIEHTEKLEEHIREHARKFERVATKIEEEQDKLDKEYPGLRQQYFEVRRK